MLVVLRDISPFCNLCLIFNFQVKLIEFKSLPPLFTESPNAIQELTIASKYSGSCISLSPLTMLLYDGPLYFIAYALKWPLERVKAM